jgi:hypothetical protein
MRKKGQNMSDKGLKGTIIFHDNGTAELETQDGERILITENADIHPFRYLIKDSNIFNEDAYKYFLELPEDERLNYLAELLDQFYRDNPEYANFARIEIYKNPLSLLDYFKAIKESHFEKCSVDLFSEDNINRYERLQDLIEQAERAINHTPIDTSRLYTIWPILRIRELFTESEMAAFYYLQNPARHYNIPFGSHLYLADYVISHAAAKREFKFDLTSTGRKKSNRNKAIDIVPTDNGFKVKEYNTVTNETHTLTVVNKDLIKSATVSKLFVFLLAKANQQNFRPVITFPLQELVRIGMYSNINNARAGLKNHIMAVQSLQIAGEIKKGKKFISQQGRVVFTGHDIGNNEAKIEVNPNLDLSYFAPFYTILPEWVFGLNNNAYEIAFYIFTKSRTERKSAFNVSFSIIRERLALPTKEEYAEKEAKDNKKRKFKPGQYVKKPIIEAIENLQAAIETNKDSNLKIEPHYITDSENLDEWLKGFITVTISGDYAKQLQEIRRNQKKIIEENTKKRDEARAKEEALKKPVEEKK